MSSNLKSTVISIQENICRQSANAMPVSVSNLNIHTFCCLGGERSQNPSPMESGMDTSIC